MAYDYADTPSKWFKFTENIDKVVKESSKYICDYSQSMELVKDESGKAIEVSFPTESIYTDNGNYDNISDWVWRRKEVANDKFAFDSEAEREWASKLNNLAKDDNKDNPVRRVAEIVTVGKNNPKAGTVDMYNGIEPEKIDPAQKYLWGKNYISNSEIKYEYCLEGIHSSYPDFVMKDSYGSIHIFEVKSVNISNSTPSGFDSQAYKEKIEELKKCYIRASELTNHIFYLPVKKDEEWHITRLKDGDEKTLTYDEFKEYIKTKPTNNDN